MRTLLMVAAIAASFVLADPAAAQGPAPVRVDAVITEPMRQTVPVLGRLVAKQQGNVAARVSGAVESVHVDVGDRVETGELLTMIDNDLFALTVRLRETSLQEAEATIRRESAAVELARQSLDRLTRLKDTAAFSGARYEDAEQELEQALSSVAAARSRAANARAQLDLAKLDLAWTEIRAPYAGVVIARQAQPGAYLSAGTSVVTIIDDTSLEIEADVPVDRIDGLAIGQEVTAVLADGTKHTLTVRTIIPEENPLTRTRAVRFAVSFGDTIRPLATNESATVQVPIAAERMVLSVHKDGVIQGPQGAAVFVVKDGAAERTPVQLGAALGERFEVVSGLSDGDNVVVRGNERLQPGQKVSF